MYDKNIIGGYQEGTEWFSNQSASVPFRWRPSYITGWLDLGYISDEQANSLRTQFNTLTENTFEEVVNYFNDNVVAGEEGCDGSSGEVPTYWQFQEASPIVKLFYLSQTQIEYLKQTDLHQANLNGNNYFGPGKIPCYTVARSN